MADELGEVVVKISEEGAEDAAETIGDATEDADFGGGADEGGGAGGGARGAGLGALAVIGAVLSQLKVVTELLGFIGRLISIFLLPLIAPIIGLLTPLQNLLLEIIGSVRNITFDKILQGIANLFKPVTNFLGNIWNGINSLASDIVEGLTPDIGGSSGGDGLTFPSQNTPPGFIGQPGQGVTQTQIYQPDISTIQVPNNSDLSGEASQQNLGELSSNPIQDIVGTES